MNFDQYIERMKEVEESQRKDNFLISVQKLVVEQHNANEILKDQCIALQKRNDMLEIELKNSNKNFLIVQYLFFNQQTID